MPCSIYYMLFSFLNCIGEELYDKASLLYLIMLLFNNLNADSPRLGSVESFSPLSAHPYFLFFSVRATGRQWLHKQKQLNVFLLKQVIWSRFIEHWKLSNVKTGLLLVTLKKSSGKIFKFSQSSSECNCVL